MMLLPSDLCNESLWPLSDCPFPGLINQQNAHAQAERYEPMLDWDMSRAEVIMECWDVEEEYGECEREKYGWEEPDILSLFSEQWWVLYHRQTSGADGHKIEPLPRKISKSMGSGSRLAHMTTSVTK